MPVLTPDSISIERLRKEASHTLENSDLLLTFFSASKASLFRVHLTDKRTGLTLSSSLVDVDVMWDALQRYDNQEEIEITHAERLGPHAIEFSCRTVRSRIEWRLGLILSGPEVKVRVPYESIKEGREDHFRLMGIRPLPRLLTSTHTFVAPLKCGALIHASRHRQRFSDHVLVYGDQRRHEDLPLLPVCGFYEEGRRGMAIIAGEGECDTFYEFHLHGDGSASSGFSFRYRYQWPSPVDPIDREFRYLALEPEDADYSGIGRYYHRFLREECDVTTLAEKAGKAPILAEMAQSMVIKTFHAMKDLDREHGDGVFHLHQTFDEAEQQLKMLKNAGIEHATVQLVGWNLDGHDGAYPIRFPVDSRVGGEAGMRKLIQAGQQLGYQMQVHDNFADSINKQYPGLIRRVWGEAVGRGIWGGGAIYAVNPKKMGEKTVRQEMERVKALGVKGVYYLDAMAPPLEIDYDPTCPVPRRAHAEGLAWTMKLGRSVFGACGTEMGFAHIARHSDYIANVVLRDIRPTPEFPTTLLSLVDDWIPLWHIAFHGLLIHAQLDRPIPSSVRLLEAAETGAIPRCDFTGRNPGTGSLLAAQWHDGLLPAYKAKFDILSKTLGENTYACIERHRSLGDGIFETTFSNGHCIEVDYQKKRLFCDSQEISIPPVFDLDLPIRIS